MRRLVPKGACRVAIAVGVVACLGGCQHVVMLKRVRFEVPVKGTSDAGDATRVAGVPTLDQ